MPVPDDLRNPLRAKTAPGQSVEHPAAPERRRHVLARGPESRERLPQGRFFERSGVLGLQGRGDRLPREASRLQLPLDPGPAVSRAANAHRRARGGEIVEEALPLEAPQGFSDRRRLEAAPGEAARQLGAAARPDGQKPKAPLARRLRGRGLGGRRAAPDRLA